MRYITEGIIIDHDNNDRQYWLRGVKAAGKDDKMAIVGGCGYCVEIRKNEEGADRYILDLVTEETIKGSVAIRNYVCAEAFLKNFTYIGDEEL